MVKDISGLFTDARDEKGQVMTLGIQAGLLGIFYGVFNITSHSIFLARFDITYLAMAYVVTGIAGVVLTFLYSRIKDRFRFNQYTLINIGFVLLATIVTAVMLRVVQGNGIVFIMFTLLGPLNIIAVRVFYDTKGVLLKESSKGNIGESLENILISGGFAGSFAVPVLMLSGLDLDSIFLLSVLSILAVFVFQSIVVRRHTDFSITGHRDIQGRPAINSFITDRYTRLTVMFILISVIVLFFVQYTFLAAARENYIGENEIARFLGVFEGCVLVFALVIRLYFTRYIIKNHGPGVAVSLGPLLVTVFTLAAAISGSALGYAPAASGFIMFFLFLALSRVFSRSVKDTLEALSLNILIRSVSKEVSKRLYNVLNGSFNEIAVIVSGIILTLVGSLFFARIIHFAWLLPFLSIAWFFAGLSLYREYRNTVRKSIAREDNYYKTGESKKEQDSIPGMGFRLINDYFGFVESLVAGDNEHSPELYNLLIKSGEMSHDPGLVTLLNRLSEHKDDEISEYAKRVSEKIRTAAGEIKREQFSDISRELEVAENKIGYLNSLVASGKRLLLTDLLFLIRNSDIEIKRIAIYQAGKYRVSEILPEICECLAIAPLAPGAYSVIRSFGEQAFKPLASTFFRSSGNIEVRILIIRLFGESGEEKAIEFLFPRLWSVHKLIRREALTGLINCGYHPDEEGKKRLLTSIDGIIALLTWNLSVSITLKGKHDPFLEEALKSESGWWLEFLFDMLSMVYSRHAIKKVRENLGDGSIEGKGLALEILDIVLDDEIKPAIKALVDSSENRHILKTLYRYNQGDVISYSEVVEDLINKDYNHISVWTKSIAVRSLNNFEDPDDMGFIIALLFSPHIILREEAGKYLLERNRDTWEITGYRLPASSREHLLKVFAGEIQDDEEIYYKVMVLSGFLDGIHRDRLVRLATRLEKHKGGDFDKNKDFLLFCFSQNSGAPSELYMRWRLCGIDNIPGAGSHLLDGKRLFKLDIENIATAIFLDPGLKEHIFSMIEKIQRR